LHRMQGCLFISPWPWRSGHWAECGASMLPKRSLPCCATPSIRAAVEQLPGLGPRFARHVVLGDQGDHSVALMTPGEAHPCRQGEEHHRGQSLPCHKPEHKIISQSGPIRRSCGALLYALAGFVALTSVLNFVGYHEAQRSLVGMGILLAAAVVMPWLGSRKRHLAAVTSSAARKAALSGLAVNAICRKAVGRPRGSPGTHTPDSARGMAGHAWVPPRMRLLSKSL
jgi:hypothetical protein